MTMDLHSLPQVTHRKRRRGRGIGSQGAKSGRGQKGAGSRAGAYSKAGFEGGQTPLYMRLPKGRGTKQRFRSQVVKAGAVAVKHLNQFSNGTIVGPEQLREAGLIGRLDKTVKIVGGGALGHKLTIRAHFATPGAKATIESAGGTVEIIS